MSIAASAQAEPAINRYRWPVVFLLAIGMIIAYFDRVNLSAAIVPMGELFDWSATQQGLAMSAIFWSYTALQIPAGYLVDRYGVRIPYLIGFLIWSLASASTALVAGLTTLVAIRILVGIGESVVTPASMRYIRLHFEEEQRGRAVGLYMTGTKLGPALGFPIAGYLVAEQGWQIMFVVIGIVSLLWLIPWMAWVKKDDIASLPKSQRVAGPSSALDATITPRQILASPVMWGIIIGTFCYMYFVYYCLTWMPSYFNEVYGMSLKEVSWYAGVSFGGMAVMIWIGGWAADWFIARGYDPINVRKIFTILGFVCASTQTLSVFVDGVNMKLFFTVFALCGLGLATANYWALTQTLIPGGSIAMVVGIQNTAANLAGIVAPALTGWLIDRTGSFDAPIQGVGVWLAVGIAAYLFLVKPKYAPKTTAA